MSDFENLNSSDEGEQEDRPEMSGLGDSDFGPDEEEEEDGGAFGELGDEEEDEEQEEDVFGELGGGENQREEEEESSGKDVFAESEGGDDREDEGDVFGELGGDDDEGQEDDQLDPFGENEKNTKNLDLDFLEDNDEPSNHQNNKEDDFPFADVDEDEKKEVRGNGLFEEGDQNEDGNGSGISSLDGSDWGDQGEDKKPKIEKRAKTPHPPNDKKQKLVVDYDNDPFAKELFGEDDSQPNGRKPDQDAPIKLNDDFFDVDRNKNKPKKVVDKNLNLEFFEDKKKKEDDPNLNLDFETNNVKDEVFFKKPNLFNRKKKENPKTPKGPDYNYTEPKPNLDYRNRNLKLRGEDREGKPDMSLKMRKAVSKPNLSSYHSTPKEKSIKSITQFSEEEKVESVKEEQPITPPKKKVNMKKKDSVKFTKSDFQPFKREKVDFELSKKKLHKSLSEGKLRGKHYQSLIQEILKKVYDYIEMCESKTTDILGLFHQNSQGSYLIRELNILIDHLLEREKTNIMKSGPFSGKRFTQSRGSLVKSLDRQFDLSKKEIKQAEKELESLVEEENRIKNPV